MEDYAARPGVTIYKVGRQCERGRFGGRRLRSGGGDQSRASTPQCPVAGGGDAAGAGSSLAKLGHRAHAAASRGALCAAENRRPGRSRREAGRSPGAGDRGRERGRGRRVVRGSFLETDLEFVNISLGGKRVRYFAAAPNHRVVAATQLGSDCASRSPTPSPKNDLAR